MRENGGNETESKAKKSEGTNELLFGENKPIETFPTSSF